MILSQVCYIATLYVSMLSIAMLSTVMLSVIVLSLFWMSLWLMSLFWVSLYHLSHFLCQNVCWLIYDHYTLRIYVECQYSECHYGECCGTILHIFCVKMFVGPFMTIIHYVFMWNVNIMSVIMVNVMAPSFTLFVSKCLLALMACYA